MNNLKQKTFSGLLYMFFERVGAQGISFCVQILLARILLPEEYGVIALITVFIEICDTFVTYGFGSSLVAKKDADSKDFSTCFYFGVCLSLVVYIIIFLSAPKISLFNNNSLLTPLIRVMAFRIPIAAVNTVQHAYVQKKMWFKKFFYSTLIGTLITGIIAVVMAYKGLGVWALVEQYLGKALIDTVCLWVLVDWRPTREFSFSRLKLIYNYGWKILAVALIDRIYSRLRNFIIGKQYSSADLAYYNRGYSFPSFGMRLVEPTVNKVLFPALAQCQDDQAQMRNITRKVIMASTYLISPIMVGLFVAAKPLVLLLLTEKWLPCVIYLQIGCIANLFRPNQFINNCVIKASGNSALLLKLDVVKKAIGLCILLISMNYGVFWIAFSIVLVYFISMVINIAPNRIILDYGYVEQGKDFAKNLIPALIMGVCVYPISYTSLRPVQVLTAQVIAGVFLYVLISVVFHNESYIIIKNILKNIFLKFRK